MFRGHDLIRTDQYHRAKVTNCSVIIIEDAILRNILTCCNDLVMEEMVQVLVVALEEALEVTDSCE